MRPKQRPWTAALSRYAPLGLALCAAALAAPRPASATVITALDLTAITATADRIVVGEIVSVSSAWDRSGRSIVSTVRVNVAEIWKGAMPQTGVVTIVQPGGHVGDIEMKVFGMPVFSMGERAILFLRGDAMSSVVGMGQGKRVMRFDPASASWMADAPDHGARLVDAQGRIPSVDPQPMLSVDELRRRVKTLVKK